MNRDKSAMKADLGSVDKEFPEWDYKKERAAFCKILRNQIERIDYETNWSKEHYTDLEAEVEIESEDGARKKVDSLLKALKKDRKSNVFLVLGNPGSGKSVSLRKLAIELLDEVERTDKVPIYVNLKEWKIKEEWSEDNPPSSHDVYDFVLQSLKGTDVFVDDFLDNYFNKMFKNGRFFLILDSFDEIPAILDKDERSWLVDKFSEVIHQLVYGAHNCRGVLSSRYYRKPTDKFKSSTTFHISPFSTNKVYETLRSTIKDEQLLKAIINRNDLVNAAKTPFLASLISSYAKRNQTIPTTQFDLYDNYIRGRLRTSSEKLKEASLTIEQVMEVAVKVANVMFKDEQLGLEASLSVLQNALPALPVISSLKIMEYIHIGRIGSGFNPNFSFVHRRFNEFFVVDELMRKPESLPKESIPTDSRWRDALVLYCSIAGDVQVKDIIDFCWNEIKPLKTEDTLSSPQYYRGIHALRFLIDAFSHKKKVLQYIENDLAEIVLEKVEGSNLLEVKLALEATGIIGQNNIEKTLLLGFSKKSNWINMTVIESCRYVDGFSQELSRKILQYIINDNIIKGFSFSFFENFFLSYELGYSKLIPSFATVHKKLRRISISRIVLTFLYPIFLIYLFFIDCGEEIFTLKISENTCYYLRILLFSAYAFLSPFIISGLSSFLILKLETLRTIEWSDVYIKRSFWVRRIEINFLLIIYCIWILSITIPLFGCLFFIESSFGINELSTYIGNLSLYILFIFPIIIIFTSRISDFLLTRIFNYFYKKTKFQNNITNVGKVIDRNELIKNIKKLKHLAFQYQYLTEIKDNRTRLIGNWSESPYVFWNQIHKNFFVINSILNGVYMFSSYNKSGTTLDYDRITTLLAKYEEKQLFGTS